MVRQRVLAVLLFLIALGALAASHTFPFLDDLPELAESAIAFLGAACLLTGVWLWLRKPPNRSSHSAGDGGRH
ncbi:hypothetical protein RM555_08600 [Micromonospora sp. DSM 115977]|uniref:Uncharacterized protein n=1 Tax=Micromonospora reichwaldensis TaxID=3075516 RepID=A0ABU2WT24_9ACTN|nr:hypothetical protein [Micromonospora sp. DSM 115977]MDT0529052.1 hypothetical protein [Micromonospora sp. DSM 115977]